MIASTPIRVRYKDTDCMKVVYYGNYLTYFEVGRVEYLRQQGKAMADVDQEIHMPVVEAGFTHHACLDAGTDKMIALPAWLQAVTPVVPDPAQRV